MTTKPYYITFVRPVGSSCWTAERIAPSDEAAYRQAVEERNKKIHFADGSLHLQSTAIVAVLLPAEIDATQQHYEPDVTGAVKRGIP